MLFDVGDKPGKNTYQCVKCNKFEVTLASDEEELPPCDECGDKKDVHYRQVMT